MKMSENKTGKYVSLNRILTATVIIAYIVFLLLLLWMDSILVVNYRKERKAEERQQVSDYADTLNEHLGKIEELMYDIYANNADFRSLNGPMTEIAEFNSVYEINQIIRNRISLYHWINGYMLSYHRYEKWHYYFEDSADISDYVNEMKEFVKEQIRNGENMGRSIVRFGGQTYCFLFFSKESVSICGVYDLSKSVPAYAGNLESDEEVFFVAAGQVYGTKDVVSSEAAEEILARTGGLTNSFEGSMGRDEYFAERVGSTDMWVVYKRPITIFDFMGVIHMLLFLLTFSTLIIAWFVFRYIKKNTLLPLRRLVETMNEVSSGNWDSVRSHDSRLEEIRRVDEAFHVMVSEIKKQKILSYEQIVEKQKAQMQYLQLQLKPHFYLNGLKTLNMLAMEGNAEKAQDLILHLSYHLRYLLQVNRALVPLAAEVDYTKNYGEIQSKMYGRKTRMRWDIQGELGEVPVPTLCIQTFVENSFKYALPEAGGDGLELGIRIYELETQDGKFIDITVRDNGVGYPLHILEDINGEAKEESVSVGINNLKRRCLFLYGGRGEYNFYNSDGAVSEIVLPWNCETFPCDRGAEDEAFVGGRPERDNGESEKEHRLGGGRD